MNKDVPTAHGGYLLAVGGVRGFDWVGYLLHRVVDGRRVAALDCRGCGLEGCLALLMKLMT